MRGINVEANSNAAFLLAYFSATIARRRRRGGGRRPYPTAGQSDGCWRCDPRRLGALITMAFNVPLNNHLDTVDPAALSIGRRRARMAGLPLDVDRVEPRPRRHRCRRGRTDADRAAVSLTRLARRCEAAAVLMTRRRRARAAAATPSAYWGVPTAEVVAALGGPQPSELPSMPFGEHRGEHVLRRNAGRWRRRNARDHVTGDAIRHLVTNLGSNCDARERNWRANSACSGQSGQLQRRRPPRQGRRHHRRWWEPRSALTDHDGAGEHVADAFALGRQQAADHRGPAEEHPDLHHRRPARETGPGGSVPGHRRRKPPAARAPSCPASCPASRSRRR